MLMHQGEVDTHKTGGTHLWKFDLATQNKIGEHKLVSPGFTFSGVPTEFGTEWIWPFNELYNVLTGFSFQEPHARPDAIVVTQDEHPTLLLGGQFSGMVAIYDASDMTFKHRVTTGNYSNLALQLPGLGALGYVSRLLRSVLCSASCWSLFFCAPRCTSSVSYQPLYAQLAAYQLLPDTSCYRLFHVF